MPSRSLTFLREIQEAITQAERLVLVIGSQGVMSEYVRAEWEYALSICKVVTPVLRGETYDLLPEPLKNIHCIDCRPTRDEALAFAELVNHLQEAE